MNLPKRPDVLIEIALRSLQRLPRFLAQRTLDEYLIDELCQSAVERQLEIAGDALGQIRKLDPALFDRIPQAALVVAFRNVLVHGYAALDHRRVFDIASSHAPALLRILESLLAEFPEDGG